MAIRYLKRMPENEGKPIRIETSQDVDDSANRFRE